jgi:uncharacterized phage-associated protein
MALTQIMPFNECRFNACMAYLARRHQRNLTKYEMIKLHILIDVCHVQEHAKPIIGGTFSPWQFGPVEARAYKRLRAWEYKFVETGAEPEAFHLVGDGNDLQFDPRNAVDEDDFSKSELMAMETAWRRVMSMNWKESQDFFHSPQNPIGLAWTNARKENRDLDWDEIVDASGRLDGLATSAIKTLIRY